jgi:hypothetical protein
MSVLPHVSPESTGLKLPAVKTSTRHEITPSGFSHPALRLCRIVEIQPPANVPGPMRSSHTPQSRDIIPEPVHATTMVEAYRDLCQQLNDLCKVVDKALELDYMELTVLPSDRTQRQPANQPPSSRLR